MAKKIPIGKNLKKNLWSKKAAIDAALVVAGVAGYLIPPSLAELKGGVGVGVGLAGPVLIGAALDKPAVVLGAFGAFVAHMAYVKGNGPFQDLTKKNFFAFDPNALVPANVPGANGKMNDQVPNYLPNPNYSGPGEYIATSTPTDLPSSMSDNVAMAQLPPAVSGYDGSGYGLLSDEATVWDAIEAGNVMM